MNRDEFILKYQPLVKYAVCKYKWYNNYDSLISAGNCRLCEIAQDVLNRDIPESKYPNYIMLHLRSAVREFIAHDQMIPCSHKTFFNRMTKQTLPNFLSLDVEDNNQQTFASLITRKTCNYNEHDIIDELNLCPLDALILDLRVRGFTQQEIACFVDIKHISERLKKIGLIVLNYLEDDKHDYREYRRKAKAKRRIILNN